MSHKSFLFLSIAILFLFCNQLNAQTNKFEIGVEASPSFTFLKGSRIEKYYNGTLGFSGGISFQYNCGKRTALRTNIAYERKGGEGEFEFTDNYGASIGKGVVNLNFDYLTIPVLVRFTFGKRIKYFLNGGSYFAYLIKQTLVFKGANSNGEINNTASYNSLDAGISLGTGLQYPINEKWFLGSEIRGNMGLLNTLPSGDTKVNSVNLLLGIAYRL
jgi:opacity protein-like surface antigen